MCEEDEDCFPLAGVCHSLRCRKEPKAHSRFTVFRILEDLAACFVDSPHMYECRLSENGKVPGLVDHCDKIQSEAEF